MKIVAYKNTGDVGAAFVARIYLGVQKIDRKNRAEWLTVICEGATEEAAIASAQAHWDKSLEAETKRIAGQEKRAAARRQVATGGLKVDPPADIEMDDEEGIG